MLAPMPCKKITLEMLIQKYSTLDKLGSSRYVHCTTDYACRQLTANDKQATKTQVTSRAVDVGAPLLPQQRHNIADTCAHAITKRGQRRAESRIFRYSRFRLQATHNITLGTTACYDVATCGHAREQQQ